MLIKSLCLAPCPRRPVRICCQYVSWGHGTSGDVWPGRPARRGGPRTAAPVRAKRQERRFREHECSPYKLGGTRSIGLGINNNGWVVGYSFTPGDLAQRAFLYDGSRMIDLNDLIDPPSGWVLHIARGISDGGHIVGEGNLGLFLLTPIPEPTTLSLLGVGGLAVIRRRR